jgi:hypothetical protein
MWLIKFIDTDPDTGEISQEKTLAYTDEENHAMAIIGAMGHADEEPNRTYFAIKDHTAHAE